LTQGTYLCSVSTMYRVLHANQEVKERHRLARHPARAVPELVATGPGQVLTWDITKLAGPDRGVYYDAYVMIDIYSRYIVGVHVHHTEAGVLAEEMMKEIFGVHGAPTVVHADRGTAMTSKSVASLLDDLSITRSHSRPHVSNDNPYSESWFKTCSTPRRSRTGSAPWPTRAPSWPPSWLGTTTSITTAGSDFIPQPMCTTAWPPARRPNASRR
jgi:transposase InsO family protein